MNLRSLFYKGGKEVKKHCADNCFACLAHNNVSKSDIGFDDSSLFHKGENEMKPEWMLTEGQIQNCFTTEFIPKMGCWLPSKVIKATAQAILKWLLQDCSMHKHRNPWPRPHKECPECMSEFKQQVGKL